MKIRELMEGVMQTGDPGMGTPEANKPGWGSGNYVSQRQRNIVGGESRENKKSNKKEKKVKEAATAGATSSANVATLGMNPALSPGPARGKKSYTGTPGQSGTKAPPQPKVKQPKTKGGTAKNALDMKANIFGQPIKR